MLHSLVIRKRIEYIETEYEAQVAKNNDVIRNDNYYLHNAEWGLLHFYFQCAKQLCAGKLI